MPGLHPASAVTSDELKPYRVLAAAMRRPGLAAAVERFCGILERIDAARIAIAMDNGLDWLAADLAALATGRVVVPLPPFFSHDQQAHVIASAGVDSLLLHDISPFGPTDRFAGFEVGGKDRDVTWLKHIVADPPRLPPGTFKISCTSGSTGRPKGVCLGASMLETVAASLVERTRGIGVRRHLGLLPLSVLLENVAGAWAALLSDADLQLPGVAETGLHGSSGLDPEQLAACLRKYRPESIIVLPQMLEALCGVLDAGMFDPSTLKFVAVGGGHTPLPLLERARAVGLPVYEGYGMTECGSVMCLNTPGLDRPGSVGKPLGHIGINVSTAGELTLSGPHHLGYVDAPADTGTEQAFATGDLGHIDAEGYVYIAGRTDNRYSTAWGRNISPEWIESELNGEPEIAQSFVHGRGLAFNVAILVTTESDPAAVDRAVERCNRRLPDYARIACWQVRRERFSPGDGTSTPNGRLRRDAILSCHGRRIEEMISTRQERIA